MTSNLNTKHIVYDIRLHGVEYLCNISKQFRNESTIDKITNNLNLKWMDFVVNIHTLRSWTVLTSFCSSDLFGLTRLVKLGYWSLASISPRFDYLIIESKWTWHRLLNIWNQSTSNTFLLCFLIDFKRSFLRRWARIGHYIGHYGRVNGNRKM